MNMLKLKFLGTGAADWTQPEANGEFRRYTSLLIDGRILVDCAKDNAFEGTPGAVLITHSHSDHYCAERIVQMQPKIVWAHESWAQDTLEAGLPVQKARFGEWIDLGGGLRAMPLPANHSTGREYEQASSYLFDKDGTRFLYMTDSAWISRAASNLIGNTPLDAIAIDATIGPEFSDDWRVFEHTSVEMALIMVRSMRKSGRLKEDAPVFLTHMARKLWPDQKRAEQMVEKPFIVCYDGMEALVTKQES